LAEIESNRSGKAGMATVNESAWEKKRRRMGAYERLLVANTAPSGRDGDDEPVWLP